MKACKECAVIATAVSSLKHTEQETGWMNTVVAKEQDVGEET
jgi:hypothetical protein